ncbi:MAG: flagellar export chaperone FliS [Gammaproteobacteria bacterium]|nr:flagellar export chaperone FliS [Gammaproteobacteria bacterium]
MGQSQNVLNAVDEYARLGLRTDIETASPHRLILLLIDGAIDKIRAARLAMERNEIATKGTNISWAISIIDGLRASLNMEKGGELASNLDRLYEYMVRTLVEANLNSDRRKLNEVEALLIEGRLAWKAIEGEVEEHGAAPVQNEIGPTELLVG